MGADRADDFGSRLRAQRERKGIALRDIATRTKISLAVLEALERNDISRLPGGIFSRAFVRSYAHEVGLDPEQSIQEFIAAFPHDSVVAGHPRSDRVEDMEMFESDRRVASSALWILAASVLLAGGVLYLSVARGDSGRSAAADTAAAPPPAASPIVQPALEPAATTGAAPVVETASTTGPPRPTPLEAPSAASPASLVRATAGEGIATDRLTVVIAARRPVWVSVTVDGQKALGRLLQTGEQETIEVTREMMITAGDAAAVRMTLNGADARAIGKTGEVVTVHLTLTNFRDYLLTR
jgi:cytoskeletal protein RodZ